MKTIIKYTILGLLSIILLALIIYFTLGIDSIVGNISSVVFLAVYILAIVYAIREKRKRQGGLLMFDEGVRTSLVINLILSVILASSSYIYFRYFVTGFVPQNLLVTLLNLEVVVNNHNLAFNLSLDGFSASAFVHLFLVNIATCLIAAWFLKKAEENTEEKHIRPEQHLEPFL